MFKTEQTYLARIPKLSLRDDLPSMAIRSMRGTKFLDFHA
jgi:hypothetical protein